MKAQDPKITYEVHSRKIGEKRTKGIAGGTYGLNFRAHADITAFEYNSEEMENAQMEHRPVNTEFVVVEARTTYRIAT